MDLLVKPARALRGTVTVPGDKSISHRAVMLGALSRGETVIENFLAGKDCLATINCFKKMGVEIKMTGFGTVRINGRELYGLSEPEDILDAGNSGTTLRLLLGILSGQSFFSVITGDRSLRQRPMARVTVPLGLMGARIGGRQDGNFAPLAVRGGRLKPVTYTSKVASAQVKSAVLLAGLFAEGETVFSEPYRSRDHTERMLKYFGAEIDIAGCSVRLKGRPDMTGQKVNVPGDISSAAFLMAAAAALPGSDLTLKGVGVNPTRDGIIEVLAEMGAGIKIFNRRQEGAEPVADIRVFNKKKLTGVSVGGKMIPRLIDDIPALAVAAAVAEGKTEIRNAGELKIKESNRIYTVLNLLAAFGAGVEELADGLLVRGGQTLKSCQCKSHGDHRIAMAAVVTGLLAGGETTVIDTGCIDISFPGFYDVLKNIRVE